MSPSTKLMAATAVFCTFSGVALASDSSDVARVAKLPVPVVDSVLTNVDAYFASPSAPTDQMMSGVVKSLALKVVKSHLSSLDDTTPGKSTDATDEEKNATYKVVVRVSRRDTSEASDCVENKVALSASEGVPAIKDGAFIFDMVHPRVTGWEWKLTFCRTPTSGGDFSEWQFAPSK
ncbi:MAG TPA: hypothetical protein VM661_09015 [Candidatus Sulfotelmatobacter sp.]|jgi:hypothetical protein|nr:hypothetical protein [Candidatus Sulfotelmatobacter sp.]